eukprot:PITA_13203
MASSSHSDNNDYVFDVFINHRGPDVKKTLATDLYHRLCKHDLRVFLDQWELRAGDNITPQLESAIRTSSVHIAIFSSGYAYSKWCLDELVLMVDSMSKSKSTIIPVFYGVKPAELRWTKGGKGVYAKALCELQQKTNVDGQPRYHSDELKKWRKALSDVAEIKGFDGETYNSVKPGINLLLVEQLLEDVVEGVLKNVKRRLYVSEYPKGLEGKLKDFETIMSLPQEDGKVRVIGIVGLGGVGKTTLAKEFFNRQRSKYKRCCFLFDIRENPLTTLQSYLLKDLVQLDRQIRSTDEGKEKLQTYLPSSDCLIILDDVDHIQQLEALLLPAKDVLKTSSLILVTSRNKDVLTSSDIPESSIYMLTGLDPQHSEELFCSHAFGQLHPVAGFDKVVKNFLDSCLGLPLSIKVLGSLLRGKNDLNHWEAQFRKISNILPHDIQGRLKISYDGLDEEEKKIFLDIACFFKGEDRDRVIRIWNGSRWEGSLGIWKLENRCLVEVDSENRLRMHDHIRDMGRYLAEKEPPDSELRLWNLTDKFFHRLSGQLPVRGISMVEGNEVEEYFEHRQQYVEKIEQSLESPAEPARTRLLSNMSGLQLLKAKGCFVNRLSSACQQLPQLIYLYWRNCPNSYLPSWIPTNNLRVLHIEGEFLKTLWRHGSQAPLQLRELCIKAPLSNVPKSIGKLKHLEKIVLLMSDLEILPKEFFNMYSLKHVELWWGEKMKFLPDQIEKLTGLQRLDLIGCSALQTLPESVGNLAGLQSLNCRKCSALQTLPDSIGNLAGLESLHLGSCYSLQTLPDSVGNLTGLRSLDLGMCVALRTLPDSVGNLAGLQRLDLFSCSTLQTLPDSVGNLAGLQGLVLHGCSSLQRLPHSIGNLASLQSLALGECSALQMLPDSVGNLAGLQSLHLNQCSALQTLPDSFGNLTGLSSLHLRQCSAVQMLPDSIGNLTGLRSLDLYKCSALQMLPGSVGNLTDLRSLDLRLCSTLQTLPDSVGNLTGLQGLDLNCCSALQTLPDSVGNLTGLQSLKLRRCSALQTLPDSVGNLRGLQRLSLRRCSALQTLPESIGNLTGLERLDLKGCFTLQRLSNSLGNLRGLQSLILSGCSSLQRLPDSIENLTSLRTLHLACCSNLEMLPNVGNLTSLRTLHLACCSSLQMVPNVEHSSSLEYLNVSQCSKLQWGVGVVEQLRQQLEESCFIEEGWQEVSSDESWEKFQ